MLKIDVILLVEDVNFIPWNSMQKLKRELNFIEGYMLLMTRVVVVRLGLI